MDSLDSLTNNYWNTIYLIFTYIFKFINGTLLQPFLWRQLSVRRKSINIYIKTADFNILDKPFFFFTWFICYFLEGIWNVEYIETPKIGKFINRRLMIM